MTALYGYRLKKLRQTMWVITINGGEITGDTMKKAC